jgi:hypothetical protein
MNTCTRIVLFLCWTMIAGVAASAGSSSNTNTLTTPWFRIVYEKNVSEKAARRTAAALESSYVQYQGRLAMAARHRLEVDLYKSGHRLMEAADEQMFNDGVWKDNKISLASDLNEEQLRSAADRVVARAILAVRVECPAWLAEAYSLNAGNDLSRYGRPSSADMTSFTDLAEDFARMDNMKTRKEVYAKLSSTITFFVNRYGSARVDSLFDHFRSGVHPDSAIQSHFGEKIGTIQEEWARVLAAQPRQ